MSYVCRFTTRMTQSLHNGPIPQEIDPEGFPIGPRVKAPCMFARKH